MRQLLAVLLVITALVGVVPKALAQSNIGYLSGLNPAHAGGALLSTDTTWWCDVASPPGCDSTHALTRATLPQITNYVISQIPPSSGGVTVPNANLTSGNGTVFGGVSVGSGLSLTGTFPSQMLTATGTPLTIPSASLLSGNGTALGSVALGTNLSLSGTFPSQTLNATGVSGGGISGTTSGQVAIAGASQTITSSKPLSNAAATTVATASGTLTNGHCVSINATGDFVDAGGACTTSGGGGTVSAGTASQVAYYAATGTAVSGSPNVTLLSGGALSVNQGSTLINSGVTGIALHVQGADTAAANTELMAIAGNANYTTLKANGTSTALTQVTSGQTIGRFGAGGYYGGSTPGWASIVGNLAFAATENWADNVHTGTSLTVNTTTTGTGNTIAQAVFGPGLSVGSPTAPTGAAMAAGDLNVQGRIMQQGVPISTGGGGIDTVTGALTAHAGGGQASATALPSQFNVVTTVATSGDSVVLPTGSPGIHVIVRNSGANPLAVFAGTGGFINAQAVNTSISVVANTTAYFEAQNTTQWFTIP